MLIFLKGVLNSFVLQGSIVPSSSFLTRRMIKPIKIKKGLTIVELGAGTGAFTYELLKSIPTDGRLIVLELNPRFVAHLKNKFHDSRVTVIEGDARELSIHLLRLNIDNVDYIISGLPIGNFKHSVRQEILSEIHSNLSEDGLYVQFQYFLASLRHIKTLFDVKIVAYEVRNIPPAFVYECRRPILSNRKML